MESVNTRFKKQPASKSSSHHVCKDQLEWAKFALGKRTVYWLLILLTIYAVLTPAIAALIVRTEIGRRTLLIGVLMTGTIGCVGRLLSNSLKLILTKRE